MKEASLVGNDKLARNRPAGQKITLRSLAQDAFVQQQGLGKPSGTLASHALPTSHVKSLRPTLPQGVFEKTRGKREELGNRSNAATDNAQSAHERLPRLGSATTHLEGHKSRWGRFAEEKAKRSHAQSGSVEEGRTVTANKIVVAGPISDAPAQSVHDEAVQRKVDKSAPSAVQQEHTQSGSEARPSTSLLNRHRRQTLEGRKDARARQLIRLDKALVKEDMMLRKAVKRGADALKARELIQAESAVQKESKSIWRPYGQSVARGPQKKEREHDARGTKEAERGATRRTQAQGKHTDDFSKHSESGNGGQNDKSGTGRSTLASWNAAANAAISKSKTNTVALSKTTSEDDADITSRSPTEATSVPAPASGGFKTGRFWSKLRALSAAGDNKDYPLIRVKQDQELDEQEIEEDTKLSNQLHQEWIRGSHNFEEISGATPSTFPFPVAGGAKQASPATTVMSGEREKAKPIRTILPPPSPFDAHPTSAPQKPLPPSTPSGRRALSLLSELFPEATRSPKLNNKASSNNSSTRRAPREVPLIPLSPTISTLTAAVNTHESSLASARTARATALEQQASRERWRKAIITSVGVLVLRHASAHLLPEDFRRISPSASKLPGWQDDGKAAGGIVKVIRARDTTTFALIRGTYFLVFASVAAAAKYRDRALDLHNYARTYTPLEGPAATLSRSTTSTPRTAKLLRQGGANIANYTLALPGHDLDLRPVAQPLPTLMRRILENGGYAGLVDRVRDTDPSMRTHDVLLTIANAFGESTSPDATLTSRGNIRLGPGAVRRALLSDGRKRMAAWGVIPERHGVRELNLGGSGTGSPMQHKKFVVAFTTESEALRFVAAWHRRDIAGVMDSAFIPEGEEVVVDAEMVW